MHDRVLVTGSEGSLAQWIIDLWQHQYHITGIDNCQRHGAADRPRSYDFRQGDLRDRAWVDAVVRDTKPRWILHCAAQIYGVHGFHLWSADILANNLASTANICQSAVRHGVEKLAYVSSSMVYERVREFPLQEHSTNDSPMPYTAYGISKLIGERTVQEHGAQHGLDWVIWRPFNIVTPLEHSESEPGIAHVFADFIHKIVRERQPVLEMFGDGSQVRCFTWIDDIAKIMARCSWDSATTAGVYNIGSETPTRIRDLGEMIWQRSGRSGEFRVHALPQYHDDVQTRIPNCDRARSLGWQHTKTLEQLVDICLEQA